MGSPNASLRPASSPSLLRLQLPLSKSILLASLRFEMGSSTNELWRVLIECQREPLKDKCTTERYADEGPMRQTQVSAFWMDRFEVTQEQYAQCVRLRRCKPIPYFKGAQRFVHPSYPASFVTWQEARDYCHFVGKRLPTEAEFERAAKGATHRKYPWGQLYNSRISNHGRLALTRTSDIDGFEELAPVGSFPDGATPEGLMDLAGNAAEWVFDRYAPQYDPKDVIDPTGPASTGVELQRVLRGGHFESPRTDLRSASRDAAEPTFRHPGFGFRCARSHPSAMRGE